MLHHRANLVNKGTRDKLIYRMLGPITPPWNEICERCDCFKEEGRKELEGKKDRTGRKKGWRKREEGRKEGRGQIEVEETSQKRAMANHFQLTLYPFIIEFIKTVLVSEVTISTDA